MSTRYALHRSVTLSVLYSVRSEAAHGEDVGCSIQGPVTAALRRAQAPLCAEVRRLGSLAALQQAEQLVRALEETPRYRALCEPEARRGGRRLLRPEVLFPTSARHPPRYLHLRSEGAGLNLPVTARAWPDVHAFLSALAAGLTAREAAKFPPALRELFHELKRARLLVPHEGAVPTQGPGALFAGHNMVRVDTGGARLLVDPWFRGMSRIDLPSYPPVQAQDVGPVDAVLITHSHGDHFHLGSLLQLPRSTRILVPDTARESLFSTDIAARLRQAGFQHVEPMAWWATARVGDAEVSALPFHGEQPTDREGIYPGLFNHGNAWLVRSPGFSCAFAADAGHDIREDMAHVFRKVGKAGPVDVLFTGIRGFRIPPLFFAFSTLDPFLVNVPLDELSRPQRLMADPREALRWGKLLHARAVVPCADGGAPWYWREGMGPRYPGYPGTPVEGANMLEENPDADPFPERLEWERARVSNAPEALLLRPGEGLTVRAGAIQRVVHPRFRWPFQAPPLPARAAAR